MKLEFNEAQAQRLHPLVWKACYDLMQEIEALAVKLHEEENETTREDFEIRQQFFDILSRVHKALLLSSNGFCGKVVLEGDEVVVLALHLHYIEPEEAGDAVDSV